MIVEDVCEHCGESQETVEHIFFHCPKAHLIWKLALVRWDGLSQKTDSIKAWWLEQGRSRKGKELQNR